MPNKKKMPNLLPRPGQGWPLFFKISPAHVAHCGGKLAWVMGGAVAARVATNFYFFRGEPAGPTLSRISCKVGPPPSSPTPPGPAHRAMPCGWWGEVGRPTQQQRIHRMFWTAKHAGKRQLLHHAGGGNFKPSSTTHRGELKIWEGAWLGISILHPCTQGAPAQEMLAEAPPKGNSSFADLANTLGKKR